MPNTTIVGLDSCMIVACGTGIVYLCIVRHTLIVSWPFGPEFALFILTTLSRGTSINVWLESRALNDMYLSISIESHGVTAHMRVPLNPMESQLT